MIRAGQRLYKERIKRKLSLEVVAKDTKIRADFLAAIEKGDYQKLPSPAYAQGFVRNYADYLGLEQEGIMALFKREFDEKKAYKVLPDVLTKTEEFPLNRIRIQQSLVVVVLFLILMFAYLLFQYRTSFIPPHLSISSPKQANVTSEEVKVVGKTDASSTVLVNSEPVSVNDKGDFMKVITLFPGANTITIKAKNRFGKETVVTREIVVK